MEFKVVRSLGGWLAQAHRSCLPSHPGYTPSSVCTVWRLVGLPSGPATGPLQWNIASRTNKRGTNRTGNLRLGDWAVGLAKVDDVRQLPETQNSAGTHEDTAACSHSPLRNPVCDTICLHFNFPHLHCQALALQTHLPRTGEDERTIEVPSQLVLCSTAWVEGISASSQTSCDTTSGIYRQTGSRKQRARTTKEYIRDQQRLCNLGPESTLSQQSPPSCQKPTPARN